MSLDGKLLHLQGLIGCDRIEIGFEDRANLWMVVARWMPKAARVDTGEEIVVLGSGTSSRKALLNAKVKIRELLLTEKL